jgi:hypothetical protein
MQTRDAIRRDVLTYLLVLVVLGASLFVLFFTYGRLIVDRALNLSIVSEFEVGVANVYPLAALLLWKRRTDT